MIVHLFNDEKFVNSTIENFEGVVKNKNRYIILTNNTLLKYVSPHKKIEKMKTSNLNLDCIYKNCNLLIIHFLTSTKLYILKYKPRHTKVLWSVWGSDAYNHFSHQDFYESHTKEILKKSVYQSIRFSKIYTLYHLLRYKVRPIREEKINLKKIDFICTVIPYEFEIITKEFDLQVEQIDYNYSVNEFKNISLPTLGNAVLVGNSATLTNNHLDVFEIIRNLNKKIIVPLNYGAIGYKDYKKNIITNGKNKFKNNFNAIESFINKDEYDKILKSCNTMIMYHIRQQGLGNIYMALYLGIRLFLNKKSVTYKYLKDIGMIVFDLQKDTELVGIELNNKQKENNKILVIKMFGSKAIKNKINKIIKLHDSL